MRNVECGPRSRARPVHERATSAAACGIVVEAGVAELFHFFTTKPARAITYTLVNKSGFGEASGLA
jgi:hypothetical protein